MYMPSSLQPELGVSFSLVIRRPRSGGKMHMVSTGQLLLLSIKHKTKYKKRELGKINTVQLLLSRKLRVCNTISCYKRNGGISGGVPEISRRKSCKTLTEQNDKQ